MKLPYRATVVLRPIESGGPLVLMERYFVKEQDAVTWCRVMTDAQPQGSGVWLVAAIQRGRTLAVTREAGLGLAVESLASSEEPAAPALCDAPELSAAEVAVLSDSAPLAIVA